MYKALSLCTFSHYNTMLKNCIHMKINMNLTQHHSPSVSLT